MGFLCWHLPLAGSFHTSTLILKRNVFRTYWLLFVHLGFFNCYTTELYYRKWPATVSQILWFQVCVPFVGLLSFNEYWVDGLSLIVTVPL